MYRLAYLRGHRGVDPSDSVPRRCYAPSVETSWGGQDRAVGGRSY